MKTRKTFQEFIAEDGEVSTMKPSIFRFNDPYNTGGRWFRIGHKIVGGLYICLVILVWIAYIPVHLIKVIIGKD